MNSNQLDQTYLLQSYNENNSLWMTQQHSAWIKINQQHDISNNNSKEIKSIGKLINCQNFVNSEKLGIQQLDDKVNQQNMPPITLFNLQNTQTLTKKVDNLISTRISHNQHIKTVSNIQQMFLQIEKEYSKQQLSNKIRKAQEFIIDITRKYKQALWKIQEQDQIIYEMKDLIQNQGKCLNDYQVQLRYFQRKTSEIQKSISRVLDDYRLKQTLQGDNYALEQIKTQMRQKLVQSIHKIKQNLVKSSKDNRQFQLVRKHKTQYIENDKNQDKDSCGSLINKFLKNKNVVNDENNSYQANRLQSHKTQLYTSHNDNPQCKPVQALQKIDNESHSYLTQRCSRNNAEKENNQYQEEDDRIENYRLLTNFRIKQLEKQNSSLKNQLKSLNAKSIILRKQNNEFQNIIENLILEIKSQCLQ